MLAAKFHGGTGGVLFKGGKVSIRVMALTFGPCPALPSYGQRRDGSGGLVSLKGERHREV